MSNICDTQYKVRGSRKALSDLWNTLQMMEVNSKDTDFINRPLILKFRIQPVLAESKTSELYKSLDDFIL